MRLSLSSAAAPGLSPAALLEGCRRRGLSGLELDVDEIAGGAPAEGWPALAERHGVAVAGLRCDGAACDAALPLAARLGVPLVVPAAGVRAAELCRLARAGAEAGGRILLLHGSDPAEAMRLRGLAEALPGGAAALAWEVDPARDDPRSVPAVLREAGGALAYVRLRGGGPESAAQTGMGVGALMARLALSRYGGPLVLSPSTPANRQAWESWLRRGGGWGCGSRAQDPGLVTLAGAPS